MPDGNMIPESGFMWSGFWSREAIPIPQHPFLRKKKLSEMPKVDGPVRSPGGFFFRARLYRVQFFIDQIKEGDPGGLVIATSPYQAVAAIFRDDETNRVALSWHKVDNIARQLFITLAGVMHDFEAAEDYHRPELLYYLDPIGYDIEDAMEKGVVKVTHITSESMLLDIEKDGYLPYNSLSDDYVVEDYI